MFGPWCFETTWFETSTFHDDSLDVARGFLPQGKANKPTGLIEDVFRKSSFKDVWSLRQLYFSHLNHQQNRTKKRCCVMLDLLFKLHNPHRCHHSVNTVPLPKCGFRQGFQPPRYSLKQVVKSMVTWGSGRYIHEAPWFEHCSPGQKSRSRTAGRHNGVLPKRDLEKGERTCTLEVNIYQHGLPQNYP